MNMVYGVLSSEGGSVFVEFAGFKISVDQRSLDRHPGIENRVGEQLVVGIRPGDFEDERIAGASPDKTITAEIDIAEMLGSETFVHYHLPSAPVVTSDIEELLADTDATAASLGDRTSFSSRVSSDVTVRTGEQARLVIDTAKFHFFDVASGSRIGRSQAT